MLCCGCQCNPAKLSQNYGNVDSPLQIRLIKMFGLQNFVLENFVFRRKPSSYSIKKAQGKKFIFLGKQIYQPPPSYELTADIIEANDHSIPIIKLTPVQAKQDAKIPCIVYAHGNSSDLGDSIRYMTKLAEKFKAEYVVFDYTGYGESRKCKVGQDVICKDLEFVLAWLKKPLNQIILWGFSLGTFPVILNAARYNVKAVILQCPIGSLSCMFQENYKNNIKFKEDHFANIDHIVNIRGRILMMHSAADEVIPIEQAHLLFKKYIAQNGERHITFIEVQKIKHNSLHKYIISPNQNDLQREVMFFLKTNQRQMQKGTKNYYKNISLDLLSESISLVDFPEEKIELDKFEITQSSSKSLVNNEEWACCQISTL